MDYTAPEIKKSKKIIDKNLNVKIKEIETDEKNLID